MRKSLRAYEDYLNGIYDSDEALEVGEYMLRNRGAKKLLSNGKYGTALRRFDIVAFNVGYSEWDAHQVISYGLE